MFFNGVYYRGSSEMSQIHTQWSHFWRLWVIVDFGGVLIQKFGQFIIQSLSCSSMECTIGATQGQASQSSEKRPGLGYFWRHLSSIHSERQGQSGAGRIVTSSRQLFSFVCQSRTPPSPLLSSPRRWLPSSACPALGVHQWWESRWCGRQELIGGGTVW